MGLKVSLSASKGKSYAGNPRHALSIPGAIAAGVRR